LPTAFSLSRFIPLLTERIWVLNPFTRQFLVGWITLLDSIPDLELVVYLPDFLGGLLKFLSDPNRDVHVATRSCLDKFLNEIKRISHIRKGISESKKSKDEKSRRASFTETGSSMHSGPEEGDEISSADEDEGSEEDWIPGQDVQINHRAILDILTANLDSPLGTCEHPPASTERDHLGCCN
jgi:vacuole morphology and inheritance protein 14